MKLSLTHQSWSSGVWIEGEFEDGRNIYEHGVSFAHRDELNEPLKYCAVIDYNKVKIESSQFDGYDKHAIGETPNIPKSATCNP